MPTILISGASSGLGAEMDRRVEIQRLDVNDHDAVFEAFRAFRGDFGSIDRVVVNAVWARARRSAPAGSTPTLRPR